MDWYLKLDKDSFCDNYRGKPAAKRSYLLDYLSNWSYLLDYLSRPGRRRNPWFWGVCKDHDVKSVALIFKMSCLKQKQLFAINHGYSAFKISEYLETQSQWSWSSTDRVFIQIISATSNKHSTQLFLYLSDKKNQKLLSTQWKVKVAAVFM